MEMKRRKPKMTTDEIYRQWAFDNNPGLQYVTESIKERISQVIEVVKRFQDYRPLTLRTVWYQFVGDGILPNKAQETKKLYQVIDKGIQLWNINQAEGRQVHEFTLNPTWFADHSRLYDEPNHWNSPEDFGKGIRASFDEYRRNLAKDQPVVIEVWSEKDAIAEIVRKVAFEYSLPIGVGKGWTGNIYLADFARRVRDGWKQGKKTIILYLGDLDPNGVAIPFVTEAKLINEQKVTVESYSWKRIAVNPYQVKQYGLIRDAEPANLKEKDTNRRMFQRCFPGQTPVEVDAFRPDQLAQVIKEAIEAELDMDIYRKALKDQEGDKKRLKELWKSIRGELGMKTTKRIKKQEG